MRRIITLIFPVLILMGTINAQQQLQNPGFEEWEDVSIGTDEPVHWSSIKTSDNLVLNGLAPVVWGRSSDAHSGNYSVNLFNVGTLGIVATGTISTGRLHSDMNPELGYGFTDPDDDRWHSVFTDRPDSITGWFKCNPAIGDFGTVKFLLHTGYAELPGNETNYIALAYYELPQEEITQWTRFSAPFVYSSSGNPEYCLAIVTSGNGTQAIHGSTALFDDFEFIYNEASVDEITADQFHAYLVDKQLNIKIEENSHDLYEVSIIDINGRSVLETQVKSGQNTTINVSHLQSGFYIAVANNSRRTFTKKILVN